MRDGLDGGGRFIPADIVSVHTLSFLASSQVAHDHATEDNFTQHNARKYDNPGSKSWIQYVNLNKEVLNPSPCE